MWPWQTHCGHRSESYCRTAVFLCGAEIPARCLWVWGTLGFPWWPCTTVPQGQACKTVSWGCQPGPMWFVWHWSQWSSCDRRFGGELMAQLHWGLHFLCWVGWQLKCWRTDCKADWMPTRLALYTCHVLQTVRKFGLYHKWSLSVVLEQKLSYLELGFGAFLCCYGIKITFLTVEEGAELLWLN